jgi:transcriptional regulator with XRE-family HTH domain
MRVALKTAIIESGLRGYEVAREMGWSPSKLSAIISEIKDPTQEEREALGGILNKSVHELFPRFVGFPTKNPAFHPEAGE